MTPSKLLEHLQLLMSNREERLRSQFDEWYWVMGIFKNLRTWSRKGTIQEWWHVRGRSWNNHHTGASRARRQCKHSFSTSSSRSEGRRKKERMPTTNRRNTQMIDIQYEPSEKNKWRSIANANTTRSQTKTRRDAVALMESQAAEGFQKEVMLKQKKTMNSTDHCCKQYHVVI